MVFFSPENNVALLKPYFKDYCIRTVFSTQKLFVLLKNNQYYTDLPKVKLPNYASYQKMSEKYTKLRIWRRIRSRIS